ncbi:MAG: hypothetical protein WD512_14085, partial [Candidatus Paceibacterota bacterium]
MEVFYYIAGHNPYDDIKIIESTGHEITYRQLKDKLGKSIKYLNMNYPLLLQTKGMFTASIL